MLEKVELLSRTNLFESITDKSREALADICVQKNLLKKETLFREGEKGSAMYILITGNIQLHKIGPEGQEIVIRVIKPSELFAEVILFQQDKYPVTAVALKNSSVFMIPKDKFIRLLNDEYFARDFFSTLMKKMRYLAKKIQYLSSHDVEDRLFMFLEEQYGAQERITPAISKKDIATAIGTAPETLSRLLLRLRNENKMIWEGNAISIPKSVWISKQMLR